MAYGREKIPEMSGRGTNSRLFDTRPLSQSSGEYFGTIIGVNSVTMTVDILTEQNVVEYGLAVLNQGTSTFERAQAWLLSLRGKVCLVKNINGRKLVLGTIPSKLSSVTEKGDTTPFIKEGTGGDTEAAYKDSLVNNINIARTDYLDGDKVLSTTDGATFGLFKGGLSSWKVSSLAQIVLHKLKGLIRMVTRNFELHTDFGTISIQNKEDKTTLLLEGGASFKDETNPDTNKMSIRMVLGAVEGDDKQRLKIEVMDPKQNKNKVALAMGIDGLIKIECSEKAEVKSDKEIELSSTKDFTLTSAQSLTLNATKGIDIMSKSGITVKSGVKGTNITSDGITGIKGKLITLN